VREGRLDEAREALGLPADAATDSEVIDLALQLERGTALMLTGRHEEALPDLRRAKDVAKKSTNPHVLNAALRSYSMSEGIVRLLGGDAHGAVEYLQIAAKVADDVALFTPDSEKTALGCKAQLAVARSRLSMNQGDLVQAEREAAGAYQMYREQLPKLDKDNPADAPAIAEVHSTITDLEARMAARNLFVLDLAGMKMHLRAGLGSVTELEKAVGRQAEGPVKSSMRATVAVFRALEKMQTIVERVIEKGDHLDAKHRKMVDGSFKLLYDAREEAKRAGARGLALEGTVSQLEAFLGSLLRTGKVRRGDFGRFSGVVALGAWASVALIVHFAAPRLDGPWIAAVLLCAIPVALIAGFGYNAVVFRKMVADNSKLVASLLKLDK
jgi:tetratricopeptide (TPR) repeat protein